MHQRSHIPLRDIVSGAKEDAEKVLLARNSVPQRLKPDWFDGLYGTAEAVPLRKNEFFSTP